jgi:hypothetical protein
MRNFSLVKYLREQNYTPKQIAIITGYSTSVVRSMMRSPNYVKAVATTRQITSKQKEIKSVLDIFLEGRCLPNAANADYLTEMEYNYMVILSFLDVEKELIKRACPLATDAQLKQSDMQRKIPFKTFDPEQLDIPMTLYKQFVTECYCYIGMPEYWG